VFKAIEILVYEDFVLRRCTYVPTRILTSALEICGYLGLEHRKWKMIVAIYVHVDYKHVLKGPSVRR
jgi:hypothetical protein